VFEPNWARTGVATRAIARSARAHRNTGTLRGIEPPFTTTNLSAAEIEDTEVLDFGPKQFERHGTKHLFEKINGL